MNSLPSGYRALIVGGRGAIGAALAETLRADARCGGVSVLSRTAGPAGEPAIELGDEASIAAAAAALQPRAPLHLIVVATGVLHVDGHAPEKRLAELDPAVLARSFQINSIGPALLIKHLHPLLPTRGRCFLAVLSARVGSIADNRLGGWYGYRASKAALNMLLRSAAIEIARRRPEAVLAALHPGTVRSPLSKPVIGEAEATAPQQAARNLLGVLDALPAEGASGGFHAWDGQPIPF